ncbi:AGAP013310-PA [Anopheles gambiae str. PEST]|uniref:AGAP013310-PA n=1 Tax=Anopheles gambiae TaxID=7165 RepID=F5HMJ1_ANOGA|nr:AGAP013310-PA [Anopheles gambiae str. PEST]
MPHGFDKATVTVAARKARYTDTSYLIFQQLTKGDVLYAFPLVVGLIQRSPRKSAASPSVPSSPKPRTEVNEALVIDSPEESFLGKQKKPNTYKAKDTRKPAGSGIPRRQSKIAEKRKNRRSLELKSVEEVSREEEETKEEDETKVQVCDISGRGGDGTAAAPSPSSSNQPRTISVISSDEPDSVQKDIQVAVDFHHRPNSEVEPFRASAIEANNNDLRCKTANEPDRARAADSDVESVSTLTPSIGPGTDLRGADDGKSEPQQRMAAPGVQIRRKQYPYEPCYLVGSEFSDTSDFTDTASSVASDLDETEYARVELRKMLRRARLIPRLFEPLNLTRLTVMPAHR